MESRAELAPLYLAATIDLQHAVEWIADINARRAAPGRLVMGALFLKATATALREVPDLNGVRTAGGGVDRGPVHLGLTVAQRSGGLVTIVLRDADTRRLDQLMRTFREAVACVRRGLAPAEAAGATFTVTSLGEPGVQAVFPSIAPPQVAGIGFGQVAEQPSAVGGAIVCSPVVTATLAADQRVTDSHRGARFLAVLGERLQHPEAL